MEKGDQDHLNYHQPPGISADWRFGNPQPPPPQLGVMPSNPMSAGSSPPCPSVSMVDSYCPSLWDHAQPNSQGMGFPDATSASIRPPPLDSSRLEMGAAGMYLQHGGGILPPTGGLPQFAADSGFIERAARFSCLGSTSFSALMNPFGLSQPLDGYSTGLKMMLGGQNPHHEAPSMGESSKDVLGMGVDHGSPNGGSPMSSQRDAGALSAAVAGDDSGEGELNVNGLGEDPNLDNGTADPSSKGLAAKKRKRNGQEMETEQPNGEAETSNEKAEGKKCAEESDSTLAAIKSDGKNNGRNSADPPKEEYVHVRARRGQATNSHSLAERVRREKISERMKFLQDLVPGCSKVTGKAVMLDEIINYVQSLQRQVELLSMKLAAVNPHLDYNLEGMLTKDILQQRPGPSSGLGFPPEVPHALLHQSQGFILPGMPGMGTDALRRAIGAPMTTMNTYKEAKQQIPNAWENEFQNVFQMGYGTNPPIDIQDLNGTLTHPTNDS